jgi:cytochrome c
MPTTRAGRAATYALTAYVLYLNEIVGRDDVIDAKSLPAIAMPNAGNFYWAYELP